MNQRLKRKIEKRRRQQICEALDLCLQINGLQKSEKELTGTPGYQQRFTEACLRQLERRQKHQELQNTAPWKTDKDSMTKVSA